MKKGLLAGAIGLGAAAVACAIKAMKPDYIEEDVDAEIAELDAEIESEAEVEAE